MLVRRLVLAVLRAIVHELEHPAAGGGAPGEPLGVEEEPAGGEVHEEQGQAEEVHEGQAGDVAEVPATRQKRPRRPRRPARVDAPAHVDAVPGAADEDGDDAGSCVRSLVRAAGGVEEAAKVYGFKSENLARWLAGGSCSPTTLKRLHHALLNPPARAEDPGAEEHGHDEEGEHQADDEAPEVAGASGSFRRAGA